MAIDPFLLDLLPAFSAETDEICKAVVDGLLVLERRGADQGRAERLPDAFDRVTRGLHTLKGSAATIGLDDIANVCHRMEDLVAPSEKAGTPLPAEVVDALLGGLDWLSGRARDWAKGELDSPGALSSVELLGRLDAVALRTTAGNREQGTGSSEFSAPSSPFPVDPVDPETPAVSASPADSLDGERDPSGSWRVASRDVVAFLREVERLRELRLRLDERRREVARTLEVSARASGHGGLADEALVLLEALGRNLGEDADEAAMIVDAMESGLMAICTSKVSTVVEPLHRAVRDLCRQSGKQARLSIVGGEVSLDRRALEALKGPLVHLIRNAVDHGIERPDDREKRGKDREGLIVIRVERQGNVVAVELSDDGNGIDVERVREEAVRRKLMTPEQAAAATTSRLHELIFEPAFSTNRNVTETSGRGVGLDVVREAVDRQQGRLDVQSRPRQGTSFILTLPVELGSSPLLLVRCGEHQLGLPTVSVESVCAYSRRGGETPPRAPPAEGSASDLRRGPGRLHVESRGEVVPVLDMAAALGIRAPRPPVDGQPMLVVQAQGKRIGAVVDEIVGHADLVIRPLPDELRAVPTYGGAAALASGELVLIVRPAWLIDRPDVYRGGETPPPSPPAEGSCRGGETPPPSRPAEGSCRGGETPPPSPPAEGSVVVEEEAALAPVGGAAKREAQPRAGTVLVVDDSVTARAIHRAILESGGYAVHTAGDAAQALDKIGRTVYDAIISDVGMKGMDGLELTALLRSRPETRALPVVVVSIRDTDADRTSARAAGADAFVGKRECGSGRLLQEVTAAIARRGGTR